MSRTGHAANHVQDRPVHRLDPDIHTVGDMGKPGIDRGVERVQTIVDQRHLLGREFVVFIAGEGRRDRISSLCGQGRCSG